MKVVEIRGEAGLDPLRGAWNELVQASGSDTIFLSWEWVTAWWGAYGNPGELRVLTFMGDSGELRGIAPLRTQRVRRYGQAAAALSFIGDSSITGDPSDSDYLDFIIAPGFEKQVIDAFGRYCGETLGSGAVLLLNEIPSASPNLAALEELARSRGMEWLETDAPCATVQLPTTWDEYLRMLQPRFRTKVRSVLRNLESRPEVSFHFCEDVSQLERVLPALFDLHTRRWAAEGKPGVFYWDRKRRFYDALSRLLIERQWLRLSWLEWNGKILACQYGFAYNGEYSQLQEGYEPVSEHLNLGIGLRAWSIRKFIEQGLREYDFLGGVGRHKTTWGAEVKNSKRILLARKSWRNLLIRRGPDWERAARGLAKRILPRDRDSDVPAARAAQAAGGLKPTLLRQVGAEVYVRSGLPGVVRRLREKRSAGAARILYYHRVNDDRDPFFEAIPVGLFERQMRYLARHYKVVSMPELMRHLTEGSSDSVVAVTFDDGYQDNYANAYPILKRYNLPATIFLTTGSLDSGEPLWFEQIAGAIKTTKCESLDLEVDIPRRFWLRTVTERIASNDQIFRVLRQLDDAGRRQWVAEILRSLEAPELENGRMLSWEQVRAMKQNGIDFGGHTVTHPFLSRLAPDAAAWEVSECKRRIEEELQHPVEFFAYPNGREEDFNPCNKEILRSAGYRAAVTTIWGLNYPSTDRLELRRGGPWEDSAAIFASKLDWYQLVNQ